jgi:hypothetical protein
MEKNMFYKMTSSLVIASQLALCASVFADTTPAASNVAGDSKETALLMNLISIQGQNAATQRNSLIRSYISGGYDTQSESRLLQAAQDMHLISADHATLIANEAVQNAQNFTTQATLNPSHANALANQTFQNILSSPGARFSRSNTTEAVCGAAVGSFGAAGVIAYFGYEGDFGTSIGGDAMASLGTGLAIIGTITLFACVLDLAE